MSLVRSEAIEYVASLPELVRLGILVTHHDVKMDLQEKYPKVLTWHGVPTTLGEFFDLQKAKMDMDVYEQLSRETGVPFPRGF